MITFYAIETKSGDFAQCKFIDDVHALYGWLVLVSNPLNQHYKIITERRYKALVMLSALSSKGMPGKRHRNTRALFLEGKQVGTFTEWYKPANS